MDTALSPPETSHRFVSVTDQETIDHIIARLNARKQVWADLPVSGKIAYLEQMRSGTLQVAERWAAAAVKAKFIPETSPLVAEEWLSGPWALLFALARYIATLQQIQRNGYPMLRPGQVRTRPDGQVVVNVFPQSLYDRLLFSGVRGEVWMSPKSRRRTCTRPWRSGTTGRRRAANGAGAGRRQHRRHCTTGCALQASGGRAGLRAQNESRQ